MHKLTQSFISQPNGNTNTNTIMMKKKSFSSLQSIICLTLSIIILIILLTMTIISIKDFINLHNNYNNQKGSLIIKERERDAIHNALFKEQRAIKETKEENAYMENQIRKLKNTKALLLPSASNNEELYMNDNYLFYKNDISSLGSIISQSDFMFILTLFPFWKIDIKLLFKATIHRDTSQALVDKCKNAERLLVVILFDSEMKIGGFSSGIHWNGNNASVDSDNDSFLFNINKQKKYPKIGDNEGLVIRKYKLSFNQDIVVHDNYLKGVLARSDFPSEYGYISKDSSETGNALTEGKMNLKIKEMEVFDIRIWDQLSEKYRKKDK